MKRLFLLSLLACGAEPEELVADAGGAPAVESGGRVPPYLSVNGESSPGPDNPDWYPTGVAFDSRAAGWRLSCLNGRQPYLSAAGDGFLSLRCPDGVRP